MTVQKRSFLLFQKMNEAECVNGIKTIEIDGAMERLIRSALSLIRGNEDSLDGIYKEALDKESIKDLANEQFNKVTMFTDTSQYGIWERAFVDGYEKRQKHERGKD